jgi:rfaE bifunctional protein kinase chain/domain
MSETHLSAWIARFIDCRIVVIGDVFVDEYLIGRAVRLSREAPIPVLEFETRAQIPGGAANPAVNIAALGGAAVQIGAIGADAEGESLRALLTARGVDPAGLIVDPARPTTLKTRIMAQMGLRFPQQVARIDRLSRDPIDPAVEAEVCSRLMRAASAADALLFSDYRGGLITPRVIDCARPLGQTRLLAADAQGDLDKYRGWGIVKCNADEASAYLRRELRSDADFAAAAEQLCAELALTRAMVITRGADGATLAEPGQPARHSPAPAITDVYDTVGAGDTAIAVIALAACAGASIADAVALANYASGIVVRRVGNYAPAPDELRAALRGEG